MTTDTLERPQSAAPPTTTLPLNWLVIGVLMLLALAVGGLAAYVGIGYSNTPHDDPLIADSTLGELALWMAGQAEEDAPPSLLGGWAKQWAQSRDGAAPFDFINLMQDVVRFGSLGLALVVSVGVLGLALRAKWTRAALVVALLGLDTLLFMIPVVEGSNSAALILLGILLLLIVLLFAPGKATRVVGFFVAISALLLVWEGVKAGAASINYATSLSEAGWTYTTFADLDESLKALEQGDVVAVFADRKDLEDLMPAAGETGADLPYANLRYVGIESQEQRIIFPIVPAMPGRLNIAVRAEDATLYTYPSQLIGTLVGGVEGDFAVDKYLALPRSMTALDLTIFNDLNLPHLQSIAEAFLQPARRNGDFLLVRILGDAGIYTWQEALFGFLFGVVLGLGLGIVFAHSRLMERALLPYVVASQTIPILAIAPMVVIWLGASSASVAVIAAYITFFPVAINTLRGLQSPSPLAIELMQSYAASRGAILWKLRFPAALPYIFAALKVSATASVVGAIIGELPSGIGDGLGRAILDFSSDYSLTSTPKLWAAIVTAALVGVVFFVIVTVIERLVLRRYVRSAD
jgi:NitT/TauT family transport system permease protein